MSICSSPSSSSQGGSLSCNVTTVFAVLAAMTFSASGAAPTPLYQEYQSHFGLTPFMITVIFATYVLCLLLALLTVGSLSDFLGRRPAILSALGLNVAAMIIFMTAASPTALIVLLALSVIEAAILWFMPETSPLKPGALASLLPRVRIPREARAAFMSITPVHIAACALGGVYFSLMPAVVRVATC